MELTVLGASLTAGMLAAFNPCGFALLPGYLALFFADAQGAGRSTAIRRAITISASLTAGFVVVFGAVGLLISVLAWQIGTYTPYLTLIVGPLLVLLGIWLATGRELKLRLPRMRGRVGATPAGMFIYGMIYASVSLSCTLPIFLIAVTGALSTSSPAAGLAVVIAYALGMGLVMTVLTLAVALARDGLLARSRSLVRYINRGSGLLLIVAGAYLTWYGYAEIQVLRGVDGASLPDTFIAPLLSQLTTGIDRIGGATLAIVALAVTAALAGGLFLLNRSRSRNTPSDPGADPDLASLSRKEVDV